MEPVTIGLVALSSFVLYRVLSARAASTSTPEPEAVRPSAPATRLVPFDFNPSLIGGVIGTTPWGGPPINISAGDIIGSGGDVLSAAPVVSRTLPAGYSLRKSGEALAPLKMGERVVFEVMRGGGYHSALEGAWEGGADTEAVGWVNVDRVARRAGDGSSDLPLGRYTIPESDASGYHQYLDRATWLPVSPSSVGLAGYVERYGKLPALGPGSLLTVVLRDGSFTTAVVVVEVRERQGDDYVVIPKYVYRVLTDEGSGALKLPSASFMVTAEQAVDPASLVTAGASTKGWSRAALRGSRARRS